MAANGSSETNPYEHLMRTFFFYNHPLVVARRDDPSLPPLTLDELACLEAERQEGIRRGWEAVREIKEANKDEDPDEIYRIVTEVVEQVRQEQYDREQAAQERR